MTKVAKNRRAGAKAEQVLLSNWRIWEVPAEFDLWNRISSAINRKKTGE